jgi:small-conductance mechanosensitive channel
VQIGKEPSSSSVTGERLDEDAISSEPHRKRLMLQRPFMARSYHLSSSRSIGAEEERLMRWLKIAGVCVAVLIALSVVSLALKLIEWLVIVVVLVGIVVLGLRLVTIYDPLETRRSMRGSTGRRTLVQPSFS